MTTGFCVGAHVVLADYLLPGDVVRLCAEHRITGLMGVPPLWIQLAAQTWPSEAVAGVRYFANTGGRLPRVTLQRLRAIFPTAAPYLMYGLTEAFRSTYLDPREVDRRPDSIGKAIPNAEILVVREDGGLCGPGEPGELVHRGPLVTLGYWNDAERTAERFRPPPNRPVELCTPELAVWSGDVVVRDEEGFLYFVGRRDDMIKTSGYRVSPQEIEEVAYETGLVHDAVALGLEDEALGHRIVLVVTPCDPAGFDPAAVTARLRQILPGYMVPAEVVVRTCRASIAERQVRPGVPSPRAHRLPPSGIRVRPYSPTRVPRSAGSRSPSACSTSAASRSLLAERPRVAPFLAYEHSGLTRRVGTGRAQSDDIHIRFAVKPDPMPGVVRDVTKGCCCTGTRDGDDGKSHSVPRPFKPRSLFV